MQARGPLMIEHRLIERMLAVVAREQGRVREVDTKFVSAAVDFFRMYADRTHHGKEEDIFFRTLQTKPLHETEAGLMAELIKEHVYARRVVGELEEAGRQAKEQGAEAPSRVKVLLRMLLEFYPQHIVKEDETFFPAAMNYLSAEENERLLAEFREFDRTLIHEKYQHLVKRWEETGQSLSE